MLRIRHESAQALSASRLWAEVDLSAVRDNVALLRGRLAPSCRLVAVVKANAYGHGAVAVARAAISAGAAELAVASAREGQELRVGGITAPIVIVGPSLPEEAAAILEHRLRPTVADLELAAALDRAATGAVEIEVEADTGMRRHGVHEDDVLAFVRSLRVFRRLRLVAVYTHLAGMAAQDLAGMRAQWRSFSATLEVLKAHGVEAAAHACNSLGLAVLPEAHADAVRIGGALYGFAAAPGLRGLRPAMALKSRIVALRGAAPGDRIGYGGAFRVERATTLGLLPCGYADGLSRAHWNGAEVLIRGRRRSIVGHVSMNQTVVELGDLEAEVGDEVVLLGAQCKERLRPEERAAEGCSPYEVTSLLPRELSRAYVGG